MKKAIPILMIMLLSGCDKHEFFDGPDFYTDDFESYSSLDDLLVEDDLLWSFTQLTRAENYIAISPQSSSGNQSLEFYAQPSDDEGTSKSSIVKQHMAFWEGETVRLSAGYYIEGTQDLQWLFLMDLEEKTAIGAGPGMRIALVDNQLRIEYKFNEKDLIQPEGTAIEVPRNQWFGITWEVTLGRKDKGAVRLWQNDQLIIDRQNVTTLPKDILYFQQGTKGMYSNCEVGITANSHDNAVILYVDNVTFEKVE